MVDWELYFFCLVAFMIGRFTKGFTMYVGYDEEKYKKATLGILLRNNVK